MKTLDEVIKALECCENGEPDSNCKECSYIGIGSCCLERENDVLYHLKEYQEMLNNVENDPLSWEELHLLENKPVWVEHKFYKQWAIITGFGVDDNIVRFEGKQLYAPEFKEDMGERWKAYRKERK